MKWTFGGGGISSGDAERSALDPEIRSYGYSKDLSLTILSGIVSVI